MYFFIFTLCTCLFFFIHFIIICEVLYLEYLHLVIVSCIFIILFSISFHKSHSISNKSIHPSLSLKYCTKCEMHIDRYDHHCYFLDNCVGKHNYKYYCLTLLYAVIADIFYIVTYILFISGNPKKNMGEQSYHIDILPRLKESDKYTGIVCAIFLDDSKIENGATRLIPETHKILGWPDDHIDTTKLHKKEIRATVKAGSVLIFNLNLWHAGAKNISGEDRKVIFLQIKNRKEPQLLNFKKYLSEKTKAELNPFEKYLLAVRAEDPTQTEDSFSTGEHYKKKFGKNRAQRTN